MSYRCRDPRDRACYNASLRYLGQREAGMEELDQQTAAALRVPPEELGDGSPIGVSVVADPAELTERFANDLRAEYRAAKAAGREKVVFIVPVGPVGQFDRLAEMCNQDAESLDDLVIINMDEYLTPDGKALISADDPLSFRRHMQAHFYDLLDPALAPPVAQRIFPLPEDPEIVTRAIETHGGVDVCFGGVGITGHVAFNDPPEPGYDITAEAFGALPTRVLELSRETLLINSVTAARGNIDRIPKMAITVGMKEILESRKVRLYLNRPWQNAIVRKALHGPVTAHVPVSLLQRHSDCHFTVVRQVTEPAEPVLR